MEKETYENRNIEDIHAELNGYYAEAWMRGYTFRDIGSITKQREWTHIYNALVTQAIIPKAKAGVDKSDYYLPPKLARSCELRKLTFRKWSNAVGHDHYELSSRMKNDDQSVYALIAKDFPWAFDGVGNTPKPLPKIAKFVPVGDVNIRQTSATYLASSENYVGLTASAESHSAALYQLISKINSTNRIKAMKLLLSSTE